MSAGKSDHPAAHFAFVLIVFRRMPDGEDLERLLAELVVGDRLAFLRVSRLVTGYLARFRAYDFREEWPDLVQEVVAGVTAAYTEGRLRDHAALLAFVRSVTRHKLADRIRREMRLRGEAQLAWELVTLGEADSAIAPGPERAIDLRNALAALPAKKGDLLLRVYAEGMSYDEAATETGIPLGTVKRHLREGLAELRAILAVDGET